MIPEFEDGLSAGKRGDDPKTCPYREGTKKWNRWHFAFGIGRKVAIDEYDAAIADYILDADQ